MELVNSMLIKEVNDSIRPKKQQTKTNYVDDSINLIRDTVRSYFSIPWFHLEERVENGDNDNKKLIRNFIINGKQKQALLVDLIEDDAHQPEPRFEVISLDDIKRHRYIKPHQQQQSIIFIRFSDENDIQITTTDPKHISSNSIQIRLVTDEEAIKLLSEMIQSCTISNESIQSTYQQLERFIERDKVLQKIIEERSIFLKKLNQWSETLLENVNEENSSKQNDSSDEDIIDDEKEQQIKQIGYELNQMAIKIVNFKQRQQLLTNIVGNMPLLFRDIPDLNVYRTNLSETAKMLESESNQLFHRWSSGMLRNIRYDLTKQCVVIDERTNKPRITFSSQLEQFANNARMLRELGFMIHKDIERMESHVSQYMDFVHDLRKIVRFYLTVADQILLCQRPMLIDKAKAFTSLLEAKQKLTWMDDSMAIRGWINELKQFMNQFQDENTRLQSLHSRILETIKWMIDAPLSEWSRMIEKITLIIGQVKNQSYQNTFAWRKHWDYQLYKILEYYFNQMIRIKQQEKKKQLPKLKSDAREQMFDVGLNHWDRMNSMMTINNVELQFNGFVIFEPPIEILKQMLFEHFRKFIKFLSTFRAFIDWSIDVELNPPDSIIGTLTTRTLFHNIYYRNADNFAPVYHKVFDAIEELIEIRERFTKWSAMYDLIKSIRSNDYLNESMSNYQTKFRCQTLDDYQHNLKLIKDLSTIFANEYSMINEIHCKHSHLIVNIIPIKMFIKWLLNEAETVLLQLFRTQCEKDINQMEAICRQNIEQMKRKPLNINELIEFDQLINEKLEEIYSKLMIDNVTLREKIHFLKSWSSDSLINSDLVTTFDQTKYILNELENIYQNRNGLLENYKELLQTRLLMELETINDEIENFLKRWTELTDNIKQTPEVINDFQINCNQLMEKINELSISCQYFHMEIPKTFDHIRIISEEIETIYGKFHIIYEFEQGVSSYQEMEWIICRNKLKKISQYITDWVEKHPKDDDYLKSYIERWRQFLASVEICRGDSYQQIHWNHFINSILGIQKKNFEDLKLIDLWVKQEKLLECRNEILDLNKRVFNDNLLREALNELNQFAYNGKFLLHPYQTKDDKHILLIKDWHHCYNQISDCFILIQTIKNIDSSEISEEYLNLYQEWENKLIKFESLVILLNSVQRKWISLEPIYSVDQRTNKHSFFNDVNFVRFSNDFQEIMKKIKQNDAKFSYLLNVNNWDNRLKVIDQNFSATQKKLRTFIEESRQRFPRFYFLADEDLLLILSGKVDLNQSSLVKKLFVNTIGNLIYKSTTNETTNKIIEAIESIQGETIYLKKPILTDNNHGPNRIENWLQELDTEIKSTLKCIFIENVSQKHSVYNDIDLFASLPSQLLSLFCYIDFTEKVEYSIQNNSLDNLRNEYEHILSMLTKDGKELQNKLLTSLTKQRLENNLSTSTENNIVNNEHLCKIKIKQVTLDVIHFITVIESLLNADVHDQNNWCWQSQLRFYLISESKSHVNVSIRMGLATFGYSFEYLGCLGESKLVYTALTNKCFLTLTQAMDLGLGGNPYGPAGTGKTESVKALGQYFGRQVLVFNCDEAIDVKSMTRILVGLIKCGHWGCFDEFNRLQLDVLSVLSSQIQEIQNAIKNKSKFVTLDEYGQVEINNNSAIFITLNPAGKDYGGRNRIPDNLKSLFLPVSITIPDNKTIVRFLSLAEGFSDSATKVLGEKIPCWFEFARGSMSQQRHYDWGLRTIKACLESGGRRLNAFREENNNQKIDENFEITLIIDTLRQQIKSKLIETDALKFDDLIEAVFGLSNNNSNEIDSRHNLTNDNLIDSIEKVFRENCLIQNEYQMEKILQLYEQIHTRFGVVLIGPSGSGKTTIWQMLRKSLEQIPLKDGNKFTMVDVIVINPKAMPRSSLFGYIDEDTREWHDGLFSSKSREITRDDISTETTMHWIVFDGDIDPDWVEALNSVLDDNRVLTLPSGERIDFDSKKCRILFETTSLKNASPATISRLGVVSIDTIMINEIVQSFVTTNQLSVTTITMVEDYLNTRQHQLFLPISTVRSLLEHLNYCKMNNEDESKAIERISGQLSEYRNPDEISMINNLVVTKSVKRYVEILKPLVDKHICLIGPIGSGKSTLAQELIFTTTNGHLVTVDCTPTTEVSSLLKILFANTTIIHDGSNKMLRSQSGQKLWIFIKHLELLMYDKWSSNSLISLLLLMLKHNGFYHPDTFEWIKLDPGFQIILTCTDVQLINIRLLTQIHLLQLNPYTTEEINQILQAKTKQINSNIEEYFPSRYFNIIYQLDLQQKDLNNDFQQQQQHKLNFLKIGMEILDSLKHYDNKCDQKLVDYEISRTLINNSPTYHHGLIETIFNEHKLDQIYHTSIDRLIKYGPLNLKQFREQIDKWIRNYCLENDIQRLNWPLFPQTISLVADLCSFLASSSDTIVSIPIMIILGSNGSGRKFLTKTLAHNFGYDKVWLPDSILSERHLNNELNSLFMSEETSTSINNDKNSSEKKLLLLIDEIHFEILPFLRDQIFTQINSFSPSNNNLIIRVVVTTTELKPLDHLMWLRKAKIHYLKPLDEKDFQKLTVDLIQNQIDKEKLSNLDSLSPMFYQIYRHFQDILDQSPNKNNIRSYMDFVQTFIQLYKRKLEQSNLEYERMKQGVTKLNQISNQVNMLKDNALEQKQLLDSKRYEADEAFNLIKNSMNQSEDKKVELEDVQQRIKTETEELKKRKSKINEELEEIEPTLQAAKAAIGSIRSDSLSEIRSLRAPPEIIRDILEGVLRLMGVNDTSWVSMKTFLSRRGVKDEIMNFDYHRITPEIRVKVEQLLKKRNDSFKLSNAKRASAAAAPLAEWVKANVEYSHVLHKIEPLEIELKRLETNLLKAQNRIKTLDTQLQDVDIEVDSLRERMQAVTIEAAQIEINLQKSTEVLKRSETIVNDLSSEHQRWNEQLNEIELERNVMSMKCIITAAYVTRASRESSFIRRTETLEKCFQKFNVDPFSLNEFLQYETEEEVILFGSRANKIDQESITFQMIPLICDPAHKALNYFPNVEITKFSSKDWLKVLELSIRFGRTLLINDFTQFDIRLIPLIFGNIYGTIDTRFWTFIGEKKIDYNPKFSLYIMTDNLNNISPLALSIIRIVNLSPNFDNISSQLLGHIINVKRPELETEKAKLDVNIKNLQIQLKQLENELLEQFSIESGNILENVSLIEKLKYLKKSSDQVKSSLLESDRLKLDIENERMSYKELSQFAADLYFSIENLTKLCPMYYFGYQEFENLFKKALKSKSSSSSFTQDDLCQVFYHYISRALFSEHRRAFGQFLKNRYPNQTNLISLLSSKDSLTQTINEFFEEILNDSIKEFGQMVLIITAPGSDPITEIKSSMQKFGFELQMISMGSDAINEVTKKIQMSYQQQPRKQQKIICLNNLHLVSRWLPQFIQLLNTSEKTTTQPLPLILISESSEEFPMGLLEMCIKFAYESAPGLRSHLRRLRSENSHKIMNKSNNSYIEKIRTSLEYFHAICCERCFYIPFGWTKNYEFSFNEFYFSLIITEKIMNLNNKLIKNSYHLYQYMKGLFHQVIYGGKVDFFVDEIVLNLLLKRYFHPNSDFLLQNEQQLNSNDFMILCLPLNANDSRRRLMEKRLTQNLQLLSPTSNISISTKEISLENDYNLNKSQLSTLNPSGINYFRKLWTKVLTKCKINPISDLKDEMIHNNPIVENIFLEANTLETFVEKFVLFELDFAKRLILQIDHELNNIPTKKSIEECLKVNQTPEQWQNIWLNGAEMAQDFLINLARIYKKLSQTSTIETNDNLMFNLTYCFHPKLFLNSLKQFSTKKLSTTIDCLKIEHHWNENENENTYHLLINEQNKIYIKLDGIWIEGALFEDDQLIQCSHNSPFTSPMPPVTVIYSSSASSTIQDNIASTSLTSSNVLEEKSSVSIALYSCCKRQTILEYWSLPCGSQTIDEWLQMGVALVLGNFS